MGWQKVDAGSTGNVVAVEAQIMAINNQIAAQQSEVAATLADAQGLLAQQQASMTVQAGQDQATATRNQGWGSVASGVGSLSEGVTQLAGAGLNYYAETSFNAHIDSLDACRAKVMAVKPTEVVVQDAAAPGLPDNGTIHQAKMNRIHTGDAKSIEALEFNEPVNGEQKAQLLNAIKERKAELKQSYEAAQARQAQIVQGVGHGFSAAGTLVNGAVFTQLSANAQANKANDDAQATLAGQLAQSFTGNFTATVEAMMAKLNSNAQVAQNVSNIVGQMTRV